MKRRIIWVPDPGLEAGYDMPVSRIEKRKRAIPESIFRTYDIRGIYPKEINPEIAEAIIRAYAVFLHPKTVALGRDVRNSGAKLFSSAQRALLESGVDVVDIGIVPTDLFYFAIGSLDVDGGVMISASHNPPAWNGLKLSKRGAEPISSDSGLREIYALAASGAALPKLKEGQLRRKNMRSLYLDFIMKSVPVSGPRPLKILINGNFGVSAELFRNLVEKYRLPFKLYGLNDKPDGSFPKGAPDPLLPENRAEMKKLILRHKADLGIAWDADGGRVFFADEKGNFLESCYTSALLAGEMLRMHAGGTIITDPRAIWAVQEAVSRQGGRLVVARPGFSLMAERMQKENALFAGEMSGHFHFRNTFNRDNSFLPALHMLNLMFREKKSLSRLAEPWRKKYPISGEINFPLRDRSRAEAILAEIGSVYSRGEIDRSDGLTVAFPDWRFNLRASNTEPLLRLNVEARDKKKLKAEARNLSEFIKGELGYQTI